MDLLYKNKKTNQNSILSATKPTDNILKTGYENSVQLQTKLKQKSKIIIYIDEDKYYVEHSTAYALGLIKTRAIMLENAKHIELPSNMHNKLKNNPDIEIEYIKIEKKQILKVYIENSNYFIDNAAAYALGFLNENEFYNSESKGYYINLDTIENLKSKFNLEFHSFNLEETNLDKKIK